MKLHKLYLHVGLHKTATTSLQFDTFPFIEGVGFIGRHQRNRKRQSELYLTLSRHCFRKEKPTDNDLSSIKAKMHEELSKKSLLLSDEWFSTDYDGIFQGKGAPWQEKLTRLAAVVENLDCSVLVTVRNPFQAIFSLYTEFIRVGYAKQYASFLAFSENSNDVSPYFYNDFWNFLSEAFPTDSIVFLRYEHLVKNPGEFLRNMEIFFGGKSINPPRLRNITQKNQTDNFVFRQKVGKLRTAFLLIPYGIRGLIWSLLPDCLVNMIKDAAVLPETVTYPTDKEMMKVTERFGDSELFLRLLDNSPMIKNIRNGTPGK